MVKPRFQIEDLCPVRTQREVALIMGISCARVCQHEHSAIRRLRISLDPYRLGRGFEMETAEPRFDDSARSQRGSGPAQRGWVRGSKISGNGIFPLEAVCFAFNELRAMHEANYRPPILIGGQVGFVCAAMMDQGHLAVRAWLDGSGWSMSSLRRCSAELRVEIICDVPVIAAGVVMVEA